MTSVFILNITFVLRLKILIKKESEVFGVMEFQGIPMILNSRRNMSMTPGKLKPGLILEKMGRIYCQ